MLGIPVRSEMALVFERCRGRIVGITGTNGKTTTTSLCAAVIGRDGRRVHLGGNIGETMLDRLDDVDSGDWVVLELSSFQLESVEEPRCEIAAVLNISPDHLDRHGSLGAYIGAKQRIVEHAVSCTVLGWDDPVTRAMATASSAPVRFFGAALHDVDGATVSGEDVVAIEVGTAQPVMRLADIPLFGAHNVLNVLAATAVGRAAGVASSDIAAAVREFVAVPHRLEVVVEFRRRSLGQRQQGHQRRCRHPRPGGVQPPGRLDRRRSEQGSAARRARRRRGAQRTVRDPQRRHGCRARRSAGGAQLRRARGRSRPAVRCRPRRRGRTPGRRRPSRSGLLQLRPVPQLRGTRHGLCALGAHAGRGDD